MRYVALHWAEEDRPAAEAARHAACELLAAGGWSRAAAIEDLMILTPPADAGAVRRWGDRGFVVGEVYRTADGGSPARLAREPASGPAAARALSREVFGRYVAIGGGAAPGVFRDPSGGVECLVWRLGRLWVIASELASLPRAMWPPGLELDWSAISLAAASATIATVAPALTGLADVAPGVHRDLDDQAATSLAWSPADFAARGRDRSDAALAEELAARVDVAVRALVGARERVVVEVSGGLDSAIIAGSIARLGLADRVGLWLNYFGDRREGDERAYAEAVVAGFGELCAVPLPVRPLTEADFAELASQARPPTNALVAFRDLDASERIRSAGAAALVSGQGGDAVFYQMPTALILTEELRRKGPAALASPLPFRLAHRLRRSAWDVLSLALRGEARFGEGGRQWLTAVSRDDARQAHPWNQAAIDLSPAKRLQVAAIANAHAATGACRISRCAELLYPLTAQPVVEFCLETPAARLTRGGRERGLARQAFADRVPATVLGRQKKGELSAFHAQTVAASLAFLRPHLLDGRLVQAGVLHRARLEAALSRDQLLWRAGGGEILMAAALESWARHWEGYGSGRAPVDWPPRWSSSQVKARA